MDVPSLGAMIGIGALLVLVIFFMPFAARHDRAVARRRGCADDGSTLAVGTSVAAFGGDGGGSCSDGGGSC